MAFVMPTILFFLVFKYGPMLWAMGLSFTTYDMMKPPRWVGLENYESIVRDPIFRAALLNTLGVDSISLETEEPNLERVFLHHTGRALRD